MTIDYKTKKACAKTIRFDLEDGKVYNVKFNGGCSGNQQAIARMAEGMDANWVIERCEGIHCGLKGTSCPDQLAQALREALKNQ